MPPFRAGTLEEAVATVDEDMNPGGFSTAIVVFLDAFYLDPESTSRMARVSNEPRRLGVPRMDALVGAIGEHLCHRWILGPPPRWTDREWRFLSEPWCQGEPEMRGFHFVESPMAFRRRSIFKEAEPLPRARMPRDGRRWHCEGMRSGSRPSGPDDVAAPSKSRPAPAADA